MRPFRTARHYLVRIHTQTRRWLVDIIVCCTRIICIYSMKTAWFAVKNMVTGLW